MVLCALARGLALAHPGWGPLGAYPVCGPPTRSPRGPLRADPVCDPLRAHFVVLLRAHFVCGLLRAHRRPLRAGPLRAQPVYMLPTLIYRQIS